MLRMLCILISRGRSLQFRGLLAGYLRRIGCFDDVGFTAVKVCSCFLFCGLFVAREFGRGCRIGESGCDAREIFEIV